MLRILVSYRATKEDDVMKIIIKLPKDIQIYSDKCNDYCNDKIFDLIGFQPRWVRVDGIVSNF